MEETVTDALANALYALVERGTDSPEHLAAELALARYEAERAGSGMKEM